MLKIGNEISKYPIKQQFVINVFFFIVRTVLYYAKVLQQFINAIE